MQESGEVDDIALCPIVASDVALVNHAIRALVLSVDAGATAVPIVTPAAMVSTLMASLMAVNSALETLASTAVEIERTDVKTATTALQLEQQRASQEELK